MSSRNGKRYERAAREIEREREYLPKDAIAALKQFPDAKFDETIEIAFRLGVDPRKADQLVRGTVALPNGTGKSAVWRRSRRGRRRPRRKKRVPTSSVATISSSRS